MSWILVGLLASLAFDVLLIGTIAVMRFRRSVRVGGVRSEVGHPAAPTEMRRR